MEIITQYQAFDGKIFSTVQECKNYEDKLKKTYKVTFQTNVILRIDGLKLSARVKCNDLFIRNDAYGVELASLAEEELFMNDIYEIEDFLRLAKEQGAKIYLESFQDSRTLTATEIEEKE